MSTSVALKNVTKKYKMYRKTSDKILDLVLPKGYGKDFYALQNVNFEAKQGDIIGIIGVNGAGKSTISNIISGVIPPSEGSVNINGEAALISIAAGLNNELTGRENIEMKCLMLGFKKQEIEKLMPEIIEFAEIGDFIDQPVKKYSSGMKSRLGFAISVNIDPDILVIDEALSVGDKIFAQKCLEKMNSFKERGKTIFFISHSLGQIKEFCEKALWLEAGEVRAYGTVEEVLPQYEKFIKEYNQMSPEEKKEFNRRIMEKRSNRTVKTFPTRTDGKRKKSDKKGLKLFTSLFALLLVVGVAFSFMKWDQDMGMKSEGSKLEKTKQKNTASVTAEEPVKDIRYVHVDSGYVRDKPDLANSQKIAMINFGESISVEEIVKDPVEDFHWLKFTTVNQQEGWISEELVSPLSKQTNDDLLITSVESLLENHHFQQTMSLFGKTKAELGESENVIFNHKGQVTGIIISTDGITADELISQLGEPTLLREEDHLYLYHGQNYDFIFKSNGLTAMNVTVRLSTDHTKSM
jgi:teichoic acid transport system ATP-binding protein